MIEPARAALMLIDMQNGFIDAASPLCVAGAAATVPACERALHAARAHGLHVFHIRREYAADGGDVEATRYEAWAESGRPLSVADPKSLECPPELAPAADEPVVMKPSWSAFFGTELTLMLRTLGVTTIVLAGTTTPNCVRATAYDGLALGFNVVVLRDATSSRTSEVQQANLADMEQVGIQLLNTDDFAARGLEYVRDTEAEVAKAVKLDREFCANGLNAVQGTRNSAAPTSGEPLAAADTNRNADTAETAPEAAGALPPTPTLDFIETISTGWINKYLLHYTTPEGAPYVYEGASRKGPGAYAAQLARLGAGEPPKTDAVGMVPILPDGSLLLIREFRYPLNTWCISFPAGLIDAGETIREAVARELAEETGYRLRESLGEAAVIPLHQTGFSSTGMSEESVHVVYTFVEPGGQARPEDAEHIVPFILKRSDIHRFLKTNTTPIGTRCQLILEGMAL